MGAEQSRGGVTPPNGNAVPAGMSTLGPNLQKRFAKGIQYNMKVVIKGDRNVGKTCLFHRLQGHAFKDEYSPTQEIQVACIQWNYKVTDDVVKVEIWDIVDKGKVKKRDGLKMDTEEADMAPTLDAEFIDVYKGTSGVIMMLDITKYWTYEYVQRELPKIPLDIPVIIMASHRDMEDKRAVLTEEVQSFIYELDRPSDAAAVYYMEASMKDGFGLKYLYRFFNVPFLELQRQTLLAQLRRNEEDLEAIKVELDLHSKSEEQDYDKFKEYLERKRKGLPTTGVCTVAAGANETADAISDLHQGSNDVSELQDGTAMSLRSRLSQKVLQSTPLPAKLNPTGGANQRIDNFVPEGKLDTNFLSESNNPSPKPSPKPQRARINDVQISDSDDEPAGNPMVTMDQESPDEEDMVVVYKAPSVEREPTPPPSKPQIFEVKSKPQTSGTKPQSKKKKKEVASSSDESSDDGYKPIEILADDDLPNPKPPAAAASTKKNESPPPTPPPQKTSVIDMGPSPVQHINPISVSGDYKPIGESEPSSPNDVINRPGDVIEPDNDVTNSITSLEDVTLEDYPEIAVEEEHVTVEPSPVIPEIDLDILEKISYAPPITEQPKKSPKSKKRASPKRGQSPKRASPKPEPKKKPPPKKSLLDIQLTSSDEDEHEQELPETPEEPINVLDTFDEPEVPKPAPPKRLGSSGSLKLTHMEPVQITPVSEPPEHAVPVQKKEKKKKKDKRTAEEIREKQEQDELDAFFGGDEPSPVKEKLKKKKTKKKKQKSGAANNPGADEYEQF